MKRIGGKDRCIMTGGMADESTCTALLPLSKMKKDKESDLLASIVISQNSEVQNMHCGSVKKDIVHCSPVLRMALLQLMPTLIFFCGTMLLSALPVCGPLM